MCPSSVQLQKDTWANICKLNLPNWNRWNFCLLCFVANKSSVDTSSALCCLSEEKQKKLKSSSFHFLHEIEANSKHAFITKKENVFWQIKKVIHSNKLGTTMLNKKWKKVSDLTSAMNCVSPGPLLARKGFSHFLFFLLLSSLDHHQVSASGDATNKDSNSVVVGVPKKSLFCPPLVCSCSDVDLSANCSRRGFLSTPPALPAILRHLDLSNNDLESVNSSEIIRLTQLETLDLRWEIRMKKIDCGFVEQWLTNL